MIMPNPHEGGIGELHAVMELLDDRAPGQEVLRAYSDPSYYTSDYPTPVSEFAAPELWPAVRMCPSRLTMTPLPCIVPTRRLSAAGRTGSTTLCMCVSMS